MPWNVIRKDPEFACRFFPVIGEAAEVMIVAQADCRRRVVKVCYRALVNTLLYRVRQTGAYL
jgi:hypothetical protein